MNDVFFLWIWCRNYEHESPKPISPQIWRFFPHPFIYKKHMKSLLVFAYFTGFYGVDKNPVKLVSMRGQQNTCKKLVDWIFKPRGWGVRNFPGNFRQFSEKFPRIFREIFGISGNRTGFTEEVYWNLAKSLKFWNH